MAEQQNKGTKTLLIILIVLILILIVGGTAFAAYFIKNNSQKEEKAEEESSRQVLITEENVEEEVGKLLVEEEEVNTVPTAYDVVMTTVWHFPDGESSSSDAYVENAKENKTDVYFDLRLSDTQETIYESPVIPLGGKLDDIKLNRDLDPGNYDCELTYHLVDEEQNTLGTIDVVVTVIIEN